jgi:hypothetical protein
MGASAGVTLMNQLFKIKKEKTEESDADRRRSDLSLGNKVDV